MPLTSESRLEYLFQRYFDGSDSEDEKNELLNVIQQARHDDRIKQLMDGVWSKLSSAYHLTDEQSGRIVERILLAPLSQEEQQLKIKKVHIMRWTAVAATFLVLLAGGWIFYMNRTNTKPVAIPVVAKRSVNTAPLPINKPVLILGNGKSVVLDSINNGIIAHQGGIPIVKLGGQLTYNDGGEQSGAIVFNTIRIPRGSQFEIVLPDGSKVWLNAGSSLRFPTSFSGINRSVEMTGEGYFEIAKNSAMPFIVKTGNTRIKVLGTRFNLMAYEDEAETKTTLIDGSVKVSNGNREVVLKPEQEASLAHSDNGEIMVGHGDIQAAVAWKNGLFLFHNADLKSVLRQIIRWYNVDVAYQNEVSVHINGMISRKASLPQVLHMLEITSNVKFKIDGNKVTVTSSQNGG